jgi:hypothetical protein
MSFALSEGSSNGASSGPGKYWERLTPVELELPNPAKPEYPNMIRVFDDTAENGVVIVQFKSRKVATFTFESWKAFETVFSAKLVKTVREAFAKAA